MKNIIVPIDGRDILVFIDAWVASASKLGSYVGLRERIQSHYATKRNSFQAVSQTHKKNTLTKRTHAQKIPRFTLSYVCILIRVNNFLHTYG